MTIGEGLPASGEMRVSSRESRRYTRRASSGEGSSGLHLEVKRYPTMSLVIDGGGYVPMETDVELGVSICCPAGEEGLVVELLTSDPRVMPQARLSIPGGSRWGAVVVRTGSRAASAEVTAVAPGYVRDGVLVRLQRLRDSA